MSDNSNVAESIEEARARADVQLGRTLAEAIDDGGLVLAGGGLGVLGRPSAVS